MPKAKSKTDKVMKIKDQEVVSAYKLDVLHTLCEHLLANASCERVEDLHEGYHQNEEKPSTQFTATSTFNGTSKSAWTGGGDVLSDSESDDDDDRGHARFKSERQTISGPTKSAPCDISSIPDKLEISTEQQEKIDKFLSAPGGGNRQPRHNRPFIPRGGAAQRGAPRGGPLPYRPALMPRHRGVRPHRGVAIPPPPSMGGLRTGPRPNMATMMAARLRGPTARWGQRPTGPPIQGRVMTQQRMRPPIQQQLRPPPMQHLQQQQQQVVQRHPMQAQIRLQQQSPPMPPQMQPLIRRLLMSQQPIQQQQQPTLWQPQPMQAQLMMQPQSMQQQPMLQQLMQQQPMQQQQLMRPIQQQQQQTRPLQPAKKVHINPHFRKAAPSLRLDTPVQSWDVNRQLMSARQDAMQSSFQSVPPQPGMVMNSPPRNVQERLGPVWSSRDSMQMVPDLAPQFHATPTPLQHLQQFTQQPPVTPIAQPMHEYSPVRTPYQSSNAPYVSAGHTTHELKQPGSAVEPVGQPIQTLVTHKQKSSHGGAPSRPRGLPQFQARTGVRLQRRPPLNDNDDNNTNNAQSPTQQQQQLQLSRQRQNAQRQKLVARAKRFSAAAAIVGPAKKVTTMKRATSSVGGAEGAEEDEEELSPSKQIRLQFESIAAKVEAEVKVQAEEAKVKVEPLPQPQENSEQRESRLLMEQIVVQKKLRERIIKQKEQRRLAAALARRQGNGDGLHAMMSPRLLTTTGAVTQTGLVSLTTSKRGNATPVMAPQTSAQQMCDKVVEVNDLSKSTLASKLRNLALKVGPVESVKVLQSQCKALIRFQHATHAKQFACKYNRHMIDLAMVTVNVLTYHAA